MTKTTAKSLHRAFVRRFPFARVHHAVDCMHTACEDERFRLASERADDMACDMMAKGPEFIADIPATDVHDAALEYLTEVGA